MVPLPSAFVSREEASDVMATANEETAFNEVMRVNCITPK